MKHLKNLLLIVVLALGVFACRENDPPVVEEGPRDDQGRLILEGEITENRTLNAREKYILRGFVYVTDGVTLTIQPGTVIMGDKQTAGTLVVERGGKIEARGTEQNPIVFTSAQPAGSRTYGDWGGLVLVGRAPVNRPEGTGLEGGIRGSFGGDQPADNSGTLQYVRIEFGGVPLTTQSNSEINGLTMYGVGSGTTMDHIQVSYSGDDAYEWFGGTVNMKYLVAYRNFDDDFDADFGYTGKVQYALSLRDPNVADQSGSNGFESDNFSGTGEPATGPGNGLPLTAPVFANVSIFANPQTPSNAPTAAPGSGPYQSGMHLRRNTSLSLFNSLIVGYPEGLRLDGTNTLANATGNSLQLRNIIIANANTPVRGANNVTNEQALAFFNTPAYNNQIIAQANLATLGLNASQFNLTQPGFLPTAGSPLLTGATWNEKANDAFFDKVNFIGAFGAENWAQGWTNFDPQQTQY